MPTQRHSDRRAAPLLLTPSLLLAGAALLAAGPALGDIEPLAPPFIREHIVNARLSGEGRFTWFGLRIYDARLYVPARGLNLADLATQPFALQLTYARKLEGKAIAERSRDEIEKLGLGGEEQRTVWLREMTKIFPDIAAGQTLPGVHLPTEATRFYFDGRFVGAIDDPAFGRAFFAIWLDPKTSAPKLRTELLRRAAL